MVSLRKCSVLLLLTMAILLLRDGCCGELRMLQIVFHNRHRVPDHFYPTDPHRFLWQHRPSSIAVEGARLPSPGVKALKFFHIGMIQLYRLGQRIRQKYQDLVADEPEQEVDLLPSERAPPCSSLAQCFLSGFYKPSDPDQPDFDEDTDKWGNTGTSKPHHSGKWGEPELNCPYMNLPLLRLYDSDEGKRILEDSMDLYEYWSTNSGMEIQNPTDARELYQTLVLEKSLNLTTASWVDRFWPELKRQSDIHYAWMAHNQEMQKMAAGPLLGLMVSRMQKHIEGREYKKYYVYSGKNSSLEGLLAIFGAFDGIEPSFGSTIVLELHKYGELYYVRVLYFYSSRSSHSEAPEIVILRGCSEYCPYEKFKRITRTRVPENWAYECGFSTGSTMMYGVGVFILLHLWILIRQNWSG